MRYLALDEGEAMSWCRRPSGSRAFGGSGLGRGDGGRGLSVERILLTDPLEKVGWECVKRKRESEWKGERGAGRG